MKRMRCENCRRSFKPARADQRFCSARCRLKAHRAGQPVAEPARITTPVVIPDREAAAPARVATDPTQGMTDWELAEDMRERAERSDEILKQQEAEAAKLRDPCRVEPAPAWVTDVGLA